MEEIEQPIKNTNSRGENKISKIVIICLLLIGYITTFISGFFVSRLMQPIKGNNNVPSPTPPVFRSPFPLTTSIPQATDSTTGVIQETTKFLPGKHYFDDTIIAITSDKPYKALVATITRSEQERNYIQDTRVSFFDGANWNRKSAYQNNNDSTIVSNDLIKRWNITIDPSRVLKQSSEGQLSINGSDVIFSTGILTNEIGIRSLPGYTKFLSKGEGTITINGTQSKAHILYTRIYSLNASDIQFYSQSFGLQTDWVIFWDNDGNFYHLDATTVDKPTEIYKTHQVGIEETQSGSVLKTFNTNTTRDSSMPPTHYNINLQNPINAQLDLNRINSINKAPNNSFKWFMGLAEGNVTKNNGEKTQGIGIIEYISN